jgi:hypothetical protein
MNSHLPNGLGTYGGVTRQHLFANDWHLPAAGLGQPGSSDVLGGILVGPASSQLQPRPPVALQEGALRLNAGDQQQNLWREELQALQAQHKAATAGGDPAGTPGGEPSSWLLEMLGKQDAAAAAAEASQPPSSQFGPRLGTPGDSMLPLPHGSAAGAQQPLQQHTPFPSLQPRAPTSSNTQPPFGSLTPYLQPQQQQPSPQQAVQAAAAAGRAGGGAKQSLKQQQDMWRKGLFSEVFEQGPRGESPFHIPDLAPDLADIEGEAAGVGWGACVCVCARVCPGDLMCLHQPPALEPCTGKSTELGGGSLSCRPCCCVLLRQCIPHGRRLLRPAAWRPALLMSTQA